MSKRDKVIIGIGAIVAVAIIAAVILVSDTNPVKNTKWRGMDTSVLDLGKTSYEWTKGENVAKGTYDTYKGNKAKEFLDEFTKKRLAEMTDVPDEEKYGFENEIDNFKNQLDKDNVTAEENVTIEDTFVLEEHLDSTTVNGKEIDPESNVYFVIMYNEEGERHMTFINVANYTPMYFSEYTEDEDVDVPEPEVVDDSLTSDKHIPFTYKVKEGYVKNMSEESAVIYVSKDNPNEMLTISIMKETPLYGITDEFLNKTEYRDGYKATKQMGPTVTYIYMFEKDGTTYLIDSENEDLLNNFVESIK